MNKQTTMPRRTTTLLAAGLLLCGLAVRAGAAPAPAEHPAWGGFFCMALDDSDLDARDAQNRPISGTRARAELKDLFTATVFSLLAQRALPLSSLARQVLEDWLTPFAEKLVRSAARFGQEVAAAFGEGRPVRLMITLSVGLFLVLSSGGSFRPCRVSIARSSPSLLVPLRC